MKNLSFIDKIFYLLNSLLATLLLLSYLLPFISPSTIPFFAVLSLFVPVLIIINLVFFVYWLIKLKKQAFLSAFVLIIGWFSSPPFYKISSRSSSLNSDVKVMSYNVKAFDLFTNKKNDAETENTGFTFIKDKDPDILAIQEYYQSTKILLSYPYKFIKRKNDKGKFGMAIYSKYKIVNSGSLDFKNTSNNIIYADVVKQKDTIRVYNLHLESLRIKPNEENFGQENSEKLLKRVTNSFKKQVEQTNLFLTHEQQWKGKKIICGDFNNTAYSWVYNQITKSKKDAFTEAGQGLGKTFNYWFPMRIDFILTDENAIVNQFKSFSEKFSDHFPIQAKINWK
ncbi:endonuclease/exonuclease/phosphatase family protein [Polaribacter batillariae]|uniref:Endonuclease/exonuclease/phosphatase family protein n=1 Tax=Polaribacter batillariae TaxID=2808900 RepID=A0ABX7SW53_9FLAO|nr:endonuclease/exonuclease/phosphatase family protein [Polaribacter batillariae]QTD38127.1 endonuclease/exonuclease/phosphatase family protein [Polaribacter batillariae]